MNSNSRQLHLHILYVNHIKEKTEAKMPNSRKGGGMTICLYPLPPNIYKARSKGG